MRKALILLALLFLLPLFQGCERPAVNFRTRDVIVVSDGERHLTKPEVLLMALEYKSEFESYYRELLGEEFWQTELRDGMRFDEYVREYYIYRESEALIVLSDMAEKNALKLSQEEEEQLTEASKRYFEGLGEKEKAYTGADADDVFRLLKKYALSEKEIELLKKSSGSLDVSFEESRVADIQMISVGTLSEANEVIRRLEEGENFMTVAATYSMDGTIAYSVAKGDLKPELDGVVFRLREGETSDVIPVGDRYYIVRLQSSYNTLLSGNNKTNLLAARAYASWSEPYEAALKKRTIKRDNAFFSSLPLETEEVLSGNDLFSTLKETE